MWWGALVNSFFSHMKNVASTHRIFIWWCLGDLTSKYGPITVSSEKLLLLISHNVLHIKGYVFRSAYILKQESLPSSYKSFLNKHGGKDPVLLQGIKEIVCGMPFHNLEVIENYYKAIGVDIKLDPQMKIPCSVCVPYVMILLFYSSLTIHTFLCINMWIFLLGPSNRSMPSIGIGSVSHHPYRTNWCASWN